MKTVGVAFNDKALAWAKAKAKVRCANARRIGAKHFRNVSGHPTEQVHRMALLSELACARYLGSEAKYTPRHEGSGDGGVDITFRGWSIDVKFNNWPGGDLYVPEGRRPSADIGVLATSTRAKGKHLELAGWIWRERFEELSVVKEYREGGGKVRAVPQGALSSMRELKQVLARQAEDADG